MIRLEETGCQNVGWEVQCEMHAWNLLGPPMPGCPLAPASLMGAS